MSIIFILVAWHDQNLAFKMLLIGANFYSLISSFIFNYQGRVLNYVLCGEMYAVVCSMMDRVFCYISSLMEVKRVMLWSRYDCRSKFCNSEWSMICVYLSYYLRILFVNFIFGRHWLLIQRLGELGCLYCWSAWHHLSWWFDDVYSMPQCRRKSCVPGLSLWPLQTISCIFHNVLRVTMWPLCKKHLTIFPIMSVLFIFKNSID